MSNSISDTREEQVIDFSFVEKPSVVVRLVKHRVALPVVSIADGLGDCACAGGDMISSTEIPKLGRTSHANTEKFGLLEGACGERQPIKGETS